MRVSSGGGTLPQRASVLTRLLRNSKLKLPLLAAVSGCVAAGLLLPGGAADRESQNARHVILISLDGFAAENLDDPRLPLPNLRRLAAEGVRADRMTVSTPSVTWPNHTTLVTGVPPARHQVLANGRFEEKDADPPFSINPRRSKEELCKAPTVYDVAHAAGMKTAEINWPVTRGAKTLDWTFPDHPDPIMYTSPDLVKWLTTERLLAEPTDLAFRNLGSVSRDVVWTRAAAELFRKHRPNLLLLHLLNTDGQQHAHGPQSTEAFTALSLADRYVGDILEAVKNSGVKDKTAVIVTADHGFVRVTKQIRPNVRLRSRGLIRPQGQSLVWDAQSISEGGLGLVYVPKERVNPDLLARARAALAGMEGVEAILEPKDYATYGIPVPGQSDQAPYLVLAAKDGYAFANESTGEEVSLQVRPTGSHGYLQANPHLDALFVATGAGFKKGARVERIRNLDVAPTIAHLLQIPLANVEGKPVDALLRRPARSGF